MWSSRDCAVVDRLRQRRASPLRPQALPAQKGPCLQALAGVAAFSRLAVQVSHTCMHVPTRDRCTFEHPHQCSMPSLGTLPPAFCRHVHGSSRWQYSALRLRCCAVLSAGVSWQPWQSSSTFQSTSGLTMDTACMFLPQAETVYEVSRLFAISVPMH
jgi:hypothetical protein